MKQENSKQNSSSMTQRKQIKIGDPAKFSKSSMSVDEICTSNFLKVHNSRVLFATKWTK